MADDTAIEQYNKRQKVLDDALKRINEVSMEVHRCRPCFRKEAQELLDRLTFNYNQMIEKSTDNRMKSLHVPEPMSESEKLALIQLIESS